MTDRQLTVGEVAELTGVTVRTLHHYDRLGLVSPARTSAGYRLYDPADVARLQEVVAYRRLGFGLNEIPGPTTDRRLALERQREYVAARAHMSRWYFDVCPAMHRNLGDMYVADPRFAKTYEDLAPGLAEYLRDAIHANADRQEAAVG